jgi:cytochrome c-type biogenesis protein CcmH
MACSPRPSMASGTSATRRWLVGCCALLALVHLCASGFAQSLPSATAFESRLYAPCCYGGTLDIHESDLARALRAEIEARIARGETTESIQADFVSRYGSELLAARSDVPLEGMGVVVASLMLLAGCGVAYVSWRWQRPSPVATLWKVAAHQSTAVDELDARLDDELADFDE